MSILKSLCVCSLTALLFISVSPNPAQADAGYWRLTGRIENVDSDAFGVRRCELAGLRLRFRSRWANGAGCIVGFSGECPWGPTWGETSTNSQGQFSKRSLWFADQSRRRDILIEFKRLGTWHPLQVVSDIYGGTPHQSQGNVWIFNVGTLQTTAFDCPTELSSSTTPTLANNLDSGTGNVVSTGGNGPQAQPIPCGLGPNGVSTIDLAIISTNVRHRDNQPNSPPERVTWEVAIRNNGTSTYLGSGGCRVTVRAVFTIPELGTERPYEMQLNGAIGPGQTRTFTSNSGNLGEVSEAESLSYNVLFFVDPLNRMLEINELNNQALGCYTPATEFYVESPCTAASQNTSPDSTRRTAPRRKTDKTPTPAKRPTGRKLTPARRGDLKRKTPQANTSAPRSGKPIDAKLRRSVLRLNNSIPAHSND